MKKYLSIGIAAALMAGVSVVTAADGKAVYEKECTKCHGADGKGETKMGKKLGAKDYTKEAIDDAKAFKAVKEGMKSGDKVLMQPAEGISDDDIKASITYMKTFKK